MELGGAVLETLGRDVTADPDVVAVPAAPAQRRREVDAQAMAHGERRGQGIGARVEPEERDEHAVPARVLVAEHRDPPPRAHGLDGPLHGAALLLHLEVLAARAHQVRLHVGVGHGARDRGEGHALVGEIGARRLPVAQVRRQEDAARAGADVGAQRVDVTEHARATAERAQVRDHPPPRHDLREQRERVLGGPHRQRAAPRVVERVPHRDAQVLEHRPTPRSVEAIPHPPEAPCEGGRHVGRHDQENQFGAAHGRVLDPPDEAAQEAGERGGHGVEGSPRQRRARVGSNGRGGAGTIAAATGSRS